MGSILKTLTREDRILFIGLTRWVRLGNADGKSRTVEQITRSFYELQFRIAYLERRGESFQSFFADIMEKRYPSDFIRSRPWGQLGDRKNDGYIRSKRMLCQVYAPDTMSSREAVNKIGEDFFGSLPYWREYFSTWTFVHNAFNGLGPEVISKLLELDSQHDDITTIHWGQPELRLEVFELSEVDLASLLGQAPTLRDFSELGNADLDTIIRGIETSPVVNGIDLRPVPETKLEFNGLSSEVKLLLITGMTKSDRVNEFFQTWRFDPTLGDRVASSLNTEYLALRAQAFTPDDIFMHLQLKLQGSTARTPKQQVAILAILAFFFEQCEVFERPEAEVT